MHTMDTLTASIEEVHGLAGRLQQGDCGNVAELCGPLETIAVSLRDADLRPRASEGSLAKDLVVIARTGLGKGTEWDDVLFQAGRAAANMVADCDSGRDAMVAAGYPEVVVDTLTGAAGLPAKLTFAGSLHNLVNDHHAQAIQAIADWAHVEKLLQVANAVYADNQGVSTYIWGALSPIIEESAAELAPDAKDHLSEFRKALDNFDGDEDHAEVYSLVLLAISNLLETEKVTGPTLLPIGKALVRVIELPGVPDAVFAGSMNLLVDVLSLTDLDEEIWTIAGKWAESDNEKLIATGFLILGNGAESDRSVGRMIDFLPSAERLLVPETSHMVLHSLVGFLRNLSVAPQNRHVLAEAGTLDKLISVGVWEKKLDLMGSVQGGTVVLAKNLCSEKASAFSFIQNTEHIDQLLALMDRTDEKGLRTEGARVLVNVVRSLCKTDPTPSLPRLEPRVIECLGNLLRENDHPLLINEAIISLTLVATIGKQEKDVVRALQIHTEKGSGLIKLDSIRLKSEDGTFADEISQNAQVLWTALADVTVFDKSDRQIIIGVGGASCSGKTLLAKHLAQVLPGCAILHQDDYAPNEKEVPYSKQYPDLQDWDDPPTAILWPEFRSALRHIKDKGRLPDRASHDHLNKQIEVAVDPAVKARWKEKFEEAFKDVRPFIVDGFIMFWDEEVKQLLDVEVLLRVPRDTLKQRREARRTYVLQNPEDAAAGGVWEDPPEYFDKIVYPAYVTAHKDIFTNGDVENGQVVSKDIHVVQPREGDLTEAFEESCRAILAFTDNRS